MAFGDDALDLAFGVTERLGAPLAVAAWLGFVESPWYERLPSPPLAIALYFAGVIAVIRAR